MMGQRMTHHKQMSELTTKLMASMTFFAALRAWKPSRMKSNPMGPKSKLTEHRALLEQMHTLMTQQGGMMKNMPGMSHQRSSFIVQ